MSAEVTYILGGVTAHVTLVRFLSQVHAAYVLLQPELGGRFVVAQVALKLLGTVDEPEMRCEATFGRCCERAEIARRFSGFSTFCFV